ncbi:MAG TPA: isochorismatase family protein, partial [Dehalococcoidia bacterium]|nr:isochorismatase family protein [Dehalococcoidia bacterium]
EKPAVLVIDMINGFTNPELPLGADLSQEIEQIRRITEAARKAGVPVYYTTVAMEERDFDESIWFRKMPAGFKTLRAGTSAVEVDARLGRLSDEVIISKKYASSFFGTDLLSRLNSQRIDTLIVTGCTTSGCVRASAVDAVQNGLRPIVPAEAVGDRARPAHEQSLFDLQAKYADVLSVDEVVNYLESLVREARPVASS